MSLRRFLALAITALGFSASGAFAQQQPFTILSPAQSTDGSGKIEVIEFFSYACGHCYTLEPFLESWERKMPADVVFKRVPGVGSSAWTELGKIYYAFEAMGKLDTLHRKAFDAVHKENLNLANAKTRYEWIAKQGVDAAKFQEVEKSFSVQSKLKRAGQLMGSYKVDGVPMLVVNGKYVTSASHAGGATNVVPVLENLIAMARRDMGGAAPAAAKK